jgi:Methyltransferase domain
MDLKELESGVDPKTHWYYQSKKIPLIAFVKKVFGKKKIPLTLIDVGSGSGFFMYELQEATPEMISKIYLVDIGYSDEEILATKNQHIEKTKSLPDKIENAIVVMMDVLEHLEDDHAMLQAIKEKSVGDNFFFITVPAFMSLWSGHDVYLGHYRRYTQKTLRQLIHHSLFTIHHIYYFYGSIFPAVWLARKMKKENSSVQSDMKPMSTTVNGILKLICSVEIPMRKMNRVAGVTCVAEGKI